MTAKEALALLDAAQVLLDAVVERTEYGRFEMYGDGSIILVIDPETDEPNGIGEGELEFADMRAFLDWLLTQE